MDEELTYTPADFFVRRTGALYFNIAWVQKHKESVIKYMAKQLKWTDEQTTTYTEELNQRIKEATIQA